MSIELEEIGATTIMRLQSGSLSGSGVNEFKSEYDKIKAINDSKIIVDLKDVGFVDSSGLGMLVSAMMDFEKIGGKFHIYNIDDELLDLFAISNVEEVFKLIKNKEEFDKVVKN